MLKKDQLKVIVNEVLDELEKEGLNNIKETNNNSFNPNEHYEKTKEKRFKDSCKLDGIDVEVVDPNATLEEVIEKYKK